MFVSCFGESVRSNIPELPLYSDHLHETGSDTRMEAIRARAFVLNRNMSGLDFSYSLAVFDKRLFSPLELRLMES